MPEGDTIHRAAMKLRAVLERATIVSAQGRESIGDVSQLNGQVVQSIEARGKHLLLHFDRGLVIHSHMGMTGSWHVYRHDEPWRKPESFAALQLRTDAICAVCFTPKLLELVTATTLRRNAWLQRLGPDLLGPPVADNIFLARVRSQQHQPIGEVVMNQSVVSGIGNVYKSELLFLEHLHPRQPVSLISDSKLLNLRDRAVGLMRRNVGRTRRRTRFRSDGPGLWVYGRQGEPCVVCGQQIRILRQGDAARSTYFCESCQRLQDSSRIDKP